MSSHSTSPTKAVKRKLDLSACPVHLRPPKLARSRAMSQQASAAASVDPPTIASQVSDLLDQCESLDSEDSDSVVDLTKESEEETSDEESSDEDDRDFVVNGELCCPKCRTTFELNLRRM